MAHVHKRMVISLPITLIIDTETELRNSNQVFSKCDRLPQSQLVQVGKIEDCYFFLVPKTAFLPFATLLLEYPYLFDCL